jgi:hypothetical protein
LFTYQHVLVYARMEALEIPFAECRWILVFGYLHRPNSAYRREMTWSTIVQAVLGPLKIAKWPRCITTRKHESDRAFREEVLYPS